MVDYNPGYDFICAISSDVGANFNSSDATIVQIHPNESTLTWVRTSDYNYDMNAIVYTTFNGLCSSSENANSLYGYIQKRAMQWSGASKVAYCNASSDAARIYYLW